MTGDHDHVGGGERRVSADPFSSTGSWFGDGAPATSFRRSWSPDDPPAPPMTVWTWLAPFVLLTAGFALAVRFF